MWKASNPALHCLQKRMVLLERLPTAPVEKTQTDLCFAIDIDQGVK
jgi:hypothetical protein